MKRDGSTLLTDWDAPVDYRIISITGKTISQGIISSGNHSIDLKGLSSGIYFISIDKQVSTLMIR